MSSVGHSLPRQVAYKLILYEVAWLSHHHDTPLAPYCFFPTAKCTNVCLEDFT